MSCSKKVSGKKIKCVIVSVIVEEILLNPIFEKLNYVKGLVWGKPPTKEVTSYIQAVAIILCAKDWR